jgi:phosphonate transport system permease protein
VTVQTSTNVRPVRPHTAWKGWLVAAVVVGITYWTGRAIHVDVPGLIRNWHHGATNLGELTQPDYNFFPKTLSALSETIQMAVIATFIASVVGLPIFFLA